jgi:hypothetical protein
VGASKGSVSYTLYRVRGELDRTNLAAALERIIEFRFRGLTPESDSDIEHGWCVFDDMLSTEFTIDNILLDSYLRLGLRTDRWSLPGALMKARIEKITQEKLAESKRAKPTKREREEIRALVVAEMKRMSIPSASSVDVIWNLDENTVRFWTQSSTKREVFQELFETTFDAQLVPTSPSVAALNCGMPDELVGNLDGLEQAIFSYVR